MTYDHEVAFAAPTSPILPGNASSSSLWSSYSGNNGNMFFDFALREHIAFDYIFHGWAERLSARTVVLSLANMIGPFLPIGAEQMFQALHKADPERIVLVGVGCQADSVKDGLEVEPDTLSFLRFVSERSESIGVRGDYTADVLFSLGIKNIEVIGCPSMFTRRLTALYLPQGEDGTSAGSASGGGDIAVAGSLHGKFRDSVGELLRFGLRVDAAYVAQSEQFLVSEAWALTDTDSRARLDWEARYYAGEDGAAVAAWWRRNTICPQSIPEWLEWLRGFQLYVGTRFHGAVAALAADIPALLLEFDSRTRELSEYFRFPAMPISSFHSHFEVPELMALTDAAELKRVFPNRFENYIQFLDINGLPHVLRKISSQNFRPGLDHSAASGNPAGFAARAARRRLMDRGLGGELADSVVREIAPLLSEPSRSVLERNVVELSPALRIAQQRGDWQEALRILREIIRD